MRLQRSHRSHITQTLAYTNVRVSLPHSAFCDSVLARRLFKAFSSMSPCFLHSTTMMLLEFRIGSTTAHGAFVFSILCIRVQRPNIFITHEDLSHGYHSCKHQGIRTGLAFHLTTPRRNQNYKSRCTPDYKVPSLSHLILPLLQPRPLNFCLCLPRILKSILSSD